ncbi:MAG: type II secretion system protein M [Gammaproteobacteria bacterium]|nr:type II secretion system protein M [Gammaproteobacteria bacterium]NNF61841.1 type II secretion system protein M [Gammaproteobacteria bacterium]
MKEWFAGLEQREQITLLAGAVVLVLALLWVLLINPLYISAGARVGQIESLRADVIRARQLSAEIASLRKTGASPLPDANQSLMLILERTARDSGLQVNQSRPLDESTVRVRFEAAPFEALVNWMGLLAQRYSIQIDIASLNKLDSPGLVDAQLTLKRPG